MTETHRSGPEQQQPTLQWSSERTLRADGPAGAPHDHQGGREASRSRPNRTSSSIHTWPWLYLYTWPWSLDTGSCCGAPRTNGPGSVAVGIPNQLSTRLLHRSARWDERLSGAGSVGVRSRVQKGSRPQRRRTDWVKRRHETAKVADIRRRWSFQIEPPTRPRKSPHPRACAPDMATGTESTAGEIDYRSVGVASRGRPDFGRAAGTIRPRIRLKRVPCLPAPTRWACEKPMAGNPSAGLAVHS